MRESPISLESLRRSRGTFADAVGLPPSVYSDPDFYRFELEAVFGSAWLCVGRTEQIPNVGDYLAVLTRYRWPICFRSRLWKCLCSASCLRRLLPALQISTVKTCQPTSLFSAVCSHVSPHAVVTPGKKACWPSSILGCLIATNPTPVNNRHLACRGGRREARATFRALVRAR